MDSLHGVWRSSMVRAVTSWCCMTGGLQHINTHQAQNTQLPGQLHFSGNCPRAACMPLLHTKPLGSCLKNAAGRVAVCSVPGVY